MRDLKKLWKIIKEIGIADHLTCLLRNLYAGQEATFRTRHGTGTGSKLGKEFVKTILAPCLFNFCEEYIMRNTRLDGNQVCQALLDEGKSEE